MAPRAFAERRAARAFFSASCQMHAAVPKTPPYLRPGEARLAPWGRMDDMPEYNSLEKIRLQKIEDLRAAGVEAYPTRAERTHTSADAIAAFEAAENTGQELKVTLAGRIRATRAMGKISFAHIEDGAGKVQLFLRANELGPERLDFFNRLLDIGDFIQASGVMIRTKT